jgi:hypothetical protein
VECVSAHEALLGDVAEVVQREQPDDPSWHWYVVADCGNDDAISIDCGAKHNGRCYDSMHETHGLIGDMPVVAGSFTDLLEQLHTHVGQYWF